MEDMTAAQESRWRGKLLCQAAADSASGLVAAGTHNIRTSRGEAAGGQAAAQSAQRSRNGLAGSHGS